MDKGSDVVCISVDDDNVLDEGHDYTITETDGELIEVYNNTRGFQISGFFPAEEHFAPL